MLQHEFGLVSDLPYYYYVIPDPGSTPTGCGCTALHTYWSQGANREYYGFSRNLASPSLDDLTVLYAHELAESITDPDGTAVQVNPRNPTNWSEIADGAAGQYRYRLNGVLAQSYWSQAHGKFIVATGQHQNFLVSAGSVLTINGDQLANHSDTITLDAVGNGVRVTLNGETAQFDPGQIFSIVVNTLTGNDVVNVERTVSGVPVTINLGSGTDTVNISPTAHNLNNLWAPVTIHYGPGTDTLNVNDQSNTGNQTFTLAANSVSRPGSALITYGPGINFVNINAGSGQNIFNVSGTEPTFTTTLNTGNGADTVNVAATSGPLVINLGSGKDAVNLSPAGKDLTAIQGPVHVNGGAGIDDVTLNDQASNSGQVYTVSGHSFARSGSGVVTINNLVFHVTLNGGNAGNTFNVLGVAGSLEWSAINTGTGLNVVNVGNPANSLDDIQSALVINGQGDTTVVVNDQGSAGSPSYSLGTSELDRSAAGPIEYSGIQGLTLNAAGHSVFHAVSSTAGTPVTVNGDGTLHLLSSDGDNTWTITGPNAGTLSSDFLPGPVSFAGTPYLRGGFRSDTFVFADGASVDDAVNGEAGVNTLDYSAYSSTVIVDLQTGLATGVGGGVANIQNVLGGNGGGAGVYNILVGTGGNVLTGGDGRRNLLIAGASASTLIGGNDDDILIGGTTAYDQEADLASLRAVMDYWAGSGDDYFTRIANLTTGTGVPLLDASTVFNNGGGNTLLGNHGGDGELNLFFGMDPTLETTDYNPDLGEPFILC